MAKSSLFSVFGSIFIDNTKADKAIDETSKKADTGGKSIGASFGNIVSAAAKASAAVVGAASAIGAGIYKLASDTAGNADIIDKGSQKVGFSAEAYQKWDYVLGQNGDSIDSLTTYVTKLTNNLDDAALGSSTAQEKFDRLGLSVEELQAMSREEMFDTVIKALTTVEDETERAALANDLLGNKSSALAATLNSGSDVIENLKDRAEELGMVMSDDAVKAGVYFGDAVDDIKRSLKGAANTIGSSVMPIINKLLDGILSKLPNITNLITRLSPVMARLADEGLPPLFDLAEVIFPTLIELASALMPVITEVIEAILPVVLNLLQGIFPILLNVVQMILPLAVQLINALMPLLTAISPLLEVIFGLLNAVLTPLLEIVSAVLKPLISLLKTILNIILPPLTAQIELLTGLFGDHLNVALNAVLRIINNAKTYLSNFIGFIKNVFTENWKGAWQNISNIFKSIWDNFATIAKTPINFIINGLNTLIRGINKIHFSIPDWVPGIGGKSIGFNIREIDRLRVGIDYVPYDDYPALLHRGERVLRASENKAYTEERRRAAANIESDDAGGGQSGGNTYNVTLNIDSFAGTKDDAETFADALLERLQEAIDRKEKAF
nr:MAG TPA: tail tape measure [Caudoviricetes sp.]